MIETIKKHHFGLEQGCYGFNINFKTFSTLDVIFVSPKTTKNCRSQKPVCKQKVELPTRHFIYFVETNHFNNKRNKT